MPGENAGPADGPFIGYLRALEEFDRWRDPVNGSMVGESGSSVPSNGGIACNATTRDHTIRLRGDQRAALSASQSSDVHALGRRPLRNPTT